MAKNPKYLSPIKRTGNLQSNIKPSVGAEKIASRWLPLRKVLSGKDVINQRDITEAIYMLFGV